MASSGTSSEFSHVIDWVEAMEQCGDDEEFLRELLSDLRGEIDAQIVKIDEVLKVRKLREDEKEGRGGDWGCCPRFFMGGGCASPWAEDWIDGVESTRRHQELL